ncbi:MAG: hypothetical protein M3N26_10370, partial [Pseudomonadota bacterium]|nr:hypothetical protein [Pseudomonadota bacterium]
MTFDAGAETIEPVSPVPAGVDPAPAPMQDPSVSLEFILAPEDLPALARLPMLRRTGPGRPARLIWYDDPERSIAGHNLSLLRDGPIWQLDRLAPDTRHDWPACAVLPPVARATEPASLAAAETVPLDNIPFDIIPVSAFDGRLRTYRADTVRVAILHGTIRGVVEIRPACRLTLTGSQADLATLLPVFAPLTLSVPRATLAAEAAAAARG